MNSILTFFLGLITCVSCYSQDVIGIDSKYLISLEASARDLECDTVIVRSSKQSQLIIQYHKINDTTVLKTETIYNYEASYKKLVYIRTVYFSDNKKILAWTHKSLDSEILVAGELNYYDSKEKLLETFKWGSGEIGLRIKYFYDNKGELIRSLSYRGDLLVETKSYR